MKLSNRIPQKAFRVNSGFIGHYRRLVRDVVIPYQYSILCDSEKSGVIENFLKAGEILRGERSGGEPEDGRYMSLFRDSDAAKWIEAAAYTLTETPDADLEARIDELVSIISRAQEPDGYLDTYYTIFDHEKRWTNLLEGHELYCMGHMMEAACAYYDATGKDALLRVMMGCFEHLYDRFIVRGCGGYPGHPEIEEALLKMHRATGDDRCLELAAHFIDTRGTDKFYREEAKLRDWTVWHTDPERGEYQQSGKPVREQSDATGHSVRAVYLYTAMAHLAAVTDDAQLLAACDRLWDSIVNRRMYITGGIGSTALGEAFTVDYDLPCDTAYAETCASIGLIFFAARMLENRIDSRYGDVSERAFYNTALAGMQLDGRKFFYVNPLESVPGISGVAPTHRHALTERPDWYDCACCPPNLARLISAFGQYAYGESGDTAYCHLFASGDVDFSCGLSLTCETEYPYGFDISYRITSGAGRLAVRIPDWSAKYSVSLNGSDLACTPDAGYVYIPVREGDRLTVTLDDTPYLVYPSPKIPELSGRAALCRGPLVYCFEGIDNGGDILSLSLVRGGRISVLDRCGDIGGAVRLSIEAARSLDTAGLYCSEEPERIACEAIAVPYYTWGNRGENQMRVWLPLV